ncbi:serine/threonine protein kinase [Scytonema sp. UIC 10036]|uniref:protein kinase domain-containing protein n=1 Tax=Scytonema sp. UIC 10036 TaxID=2304196 RepID=UPI0012DA6FF7|nr:serine/threonine protein kinase [Scytonema sp. UIC 10036]MUG96349.1 serine/threonine protein kinase [Scytonema sp. UIC 10036]
MTGAKKRVVDVLGHVYELEKELGRGGQGAVFAVKNGNLAVKVLFDRSPVRRTHLRKQLTQVRKLDIEKLPIARPLEILNPPHLGYVMELLTDMVPISKLINAPKNVDCLVEWYLEGGGLRRRLLLLARCAETLAQLHGKGLVYTDPSPNNIFVSSDVNDHKIIRLIDADNLHYESSSSSINLYTPGHGAPELVTGKFGANTLTDAHAFAVIAFQTLSLVHPLMGNMVNEGEPELETQALEGKLPWIDEPEDNSNSTTQGFPRDIVLSPNLKELCQRCFGSGLREPTKRPGIGEWREKLYSAADFTIHCPECNSTYYANKKSCPWCNYPRPTYVQVRIQRWEPLQGCFREQKPLQGFALTSSESLILTSRVVSSRTGTDSHNPNIELVLEGENIKVRSLNGQCFWLTSEGTQRVEKEMQDRWIRFPVQSERYGSWLLHFGNLDSPHRLATFTLVSGENV